MTLLKSLIISLKQQNAFKHFRLIFIFILLFSSTILIFKDQILQTTQTFGMALAKSYGMETESKLNEYKLILEMTKNDINDFISNNSSNEQLEQLINHYANNLKALYDNQIIDIYLIINNTLITNETNQSLSYTQAIHSNWYNEALKQSNSIVFTDQQDDTTTIFTLSSTLDQNDAVIALNIYLKDANVLNIASSLPESYQFYIFDTSNSLIYSIFPLQNANQTAIEQYRQQLLSGVKDGSLFDYNKNIIDFNNVRRGVYYYQLQNGWTVIITIPIKDIIIANNISTPYYLLLIIGCVSLFIFIMMTLKDLNNQKKIHYDGLTGLLNKTSIQQQVIKFLQKSDGIFIILDLDNFKQINDLYGHEQGDIVLKQVAKALQETFRTTDLIGRFGGDEFIVLVTKTIDLSSLSTRLQSILNKINIIANDYPKANLSISIGATYCHKNDNYKDLFNHTDQLLYEIKQSGKNTYKIHQ